MKRWEIAATVAGSLALLGGIIGAILAIYKRNQTKGKTTRSLYIQ